ncbi:MAG: hypothetical protein FJW30_29085, partial [Acidobacteria bacterium]|nr:hypothetical protein [Acidobacteriota bacterium]
MRLTTGDRLGRFEIRAPIGAGGMGEVYCARDSSLGRDVALKILPAEMSSDKDRLARFYREARSAAALNHPNIVTLFSVEEISGIHFLTMELIDGKPLNEVAAEGGFTVKAAVELAASIAEAVAAAHDKGIVHRDLKPANIMITRDGRVKVLDFGLSKELQTISPDEATLTFHHETEAGTVMGTPAYMSPEQISGAAVDHRSDIFSLGIILYEMLATRRPFAGASHFELAASILRDNPAPIAGADVPPDLLQLLDRCLAKKPADRLQSARELASGFRAITSGLSMAEPKPHGLRHAPPAEENLWIGVLPFKSRTGDTLAAALAEGLTEDITAGFSRFSYLRVLAPGATARYTGDQTDPRTVGTQLGARYVLEGSLRQNGPICRLTVRLVETATGAQLWSHASDRRIDAENLFALQDEWVSAVVARVADQHGVLVHDMVRTFRNKKPEDLTPHEAVLSVFSFHERMSEQEHARLRRVLERLVKESPDSSDCWAMLATLYSDEYMFGFSGEPDPLSRARDAAQRAVALAPTNPLACQAQHQSLFFRREWQAFRPVAERTLALNPLDSATVAFAGILLASSGAWDQGCAAIERAIGLNPDHPGWYWIGPVFRAFHLEDYQSAVDCAMRLNMPGYFWGPAALASAYGH